MKLRSAAVLALLAAAPLVAKDPAPKAAKVTAPEPGLRLDPSLIKLPARAIGPAVMGGRISEIALDPRDPFTFYVGLATGGVLKTGNAGATFSAIFEKEAVASIGAVAVSPSNPKVVWVGTGEANDRNSSGWGDGVYRSTDGGETFANVGLRDSRAIARIVVHPSDPDTAWVAAVGDLWQPGGERGLFKTQDGGKTWKAVLQATGPDRGRVGCGDVVLAPSQPDTLFAVLYARQRTPWSFVSGPSASGGQDLGGIFKSTDGGGTWRKLDKGLPTKTQRIGLDVFRKDPRIVYAVVQSEDGGQTAIRDNRSKSGGVFRSEDGGDSWTRMNALNPRPFYFSQIRVDPRNDQRIYVLGMTLHASDDGGRTFREDLFGKVHPDNHALALYPEELSTAEGEGPKVCRRALLGTDGGLYQTFDAAKTWQHLTNFTAGEFYRVTLDDQKPYRIAGGLQDNLSWVGPSRTQTKDGITNSDWISLGGGDGFSCVFDPEDPNVLYAESQQGEVFRINLRNGESKELRPEAAEGQLGFRYHWNAPLIGSRHHKGTLFLAGNHVFALTNRGERWEVISPDLSARDPQKNYAVGSGAENYGVVYTLAESPVTADLLWAGTDDGKLWKTHDLGKTWTDLTDGLPAAVKGQWISRVHASAHDDKVAYLAVDAHRTGSFAPLAYRTADGGKTWQTISANLPANGPVKVVRDDPRNPDLLFAGTEFGLFASLDQGKSWTRLGDLPTVAVDDLAIHPREHDLVVATHGRSLYVFDDVSPLRGLGHDVLAKDAHLFPPRPAHGIRLLPGWEESAGKGNFRGKNPPEGAILTYWLKAATTEDVKVTITNSQGQPVAELKGKGTPGLNRVTWDLQRTKDFLATYGGDNKEKLVTPGTYKVTLSAGKLKAEEKLVVTVEAGLETY